MRQALAGSLGSARPTTDSLRLALGAFGVASSVETAAISVAWLDQSLDGFAGTSGPCAVVGLGQLERLDELASALGRGAKTPTGELVAEAYARWGSQLPERLRGRCVMAAWNNESNAALLAVDRLAAGAVFVCRRGGSLLFATELPPLLRLLEAQPAPDQSAVVQWLVNGTTPYGRTLYEGIRRLDYAEAVVAEDGRLESKRYWSPRYQEPLTGGRPELAEHIRENVNRAVARMLPPAGGAAAIFVSGGLDSATVAAVATATAAGSGNALRGYCATFPDHPTMDESELVGELSSDLALPVQLLPVPTTSMLVAALDHLATWRVPSLSPNLHFLRRLAAAAREDGASLVLDGQGGDELFGLAPFYLADLVRHGRVGRAAALARRFPGLGASPTTEQQKKLLWEFGLKGALPVSARRLERRLRGVERHTPSWLNNEAGRALVEADDGWGWKTRADGPLWWRARVDDLFAQRQRLGASDYLRQMVAPAMVDLHPFLDDVDLIELALRLPPEASFDADFDRPLLRAATTSLLPDSIRLRKDKSYFNPLFQACLDGPDRHAIETLLGAGDARVYAYVRPEAVRKLIFETPPDRKDGAWAWFTWRLLAIETWLRSLEDPSFPTRAAEELGLR